MADEPGAGSSKAAIDYSFTKGVVAGVVFSHINKRLLLGILVGTLTGAYIQQNYQGIPISRKRRKSWLKLFEKRWRKRNPDHVGRLFQDKIMISIVNQTSAMATM